MKPMMRISSLAFGTNKRVCLINFPAEVEPRRKAHVFRTSGFDRQCCKKILLIPASKIDSGNRRRCAITETGLHHACEPAVQQLDSESDKETQPPARGKARKIKICGCPNLVRIFCDKIC